ncbi:MAG: citrate synthase family protein [Vicinamibacterales bacterium]
MTATWLTASESAERLGVSRATLYAYVSRGLIRSAEGPDGRQRRYRQDDVEALRERKAVRARQAVAARAMSFGTPVLESALSLIADGRLYYRGEDVAGLAVSASLEDVARLLWQADARAFAAANRPPRARAFARAWEAVASLAPLDRCLALLPHAAALDAEIWSLDPDALRLTGARLLRLLAAIVVGRPPSSEPVDAVLGSAWHLDADAQRLVRAALVLCADHELNASTFAARVVASTGASAYAVVSAGLAALSGPRHGGQAAQVAALVDAAAAAGDVDAVLRTRVRQGLGVPGFGHKLYPDGDIRAKVLLGMLDGLRPEPPALPLMKELAVAGEAVTGQAPNLDVSLAAVERVLALPPGAALSLFLLGRSVGWIAHMLEQAERPDIIRPRAHYVGRR